MDFSEIIKERFRAVRDNKVGCIKILDTWNEQIKNIADFDVNIPDNHPAIKIITDLELNALIECLDKEGYLDKIIKSKKKTVTKKKA